MADVLTSLQRQIMRYLRDNVHAAETAEGVNSMWLGRAHEPQSIAESEKALDALVAAGLVETHSLPGGKTLYRARP